MFYVYVLYHPTKPGVVVYVGKGQRDRVSKHAAFGDKHYNKTLASYYKRKGEPLISEIVYYTENELEAFEHERLLIKRYGRLDLKTGTLANLTAGGEGFSGYLMTAEQIAAIAASKKGVPQTPESNAKRSATLTGYKRTPEHRANNGAALRGLKRTPEARAKMAAARTAYYADPQNRTAQGERQRAHQERLRKIET